MPGYRGITQAGWRGSPYISPKILTFTERLKPQNSLIIYKFQKLFHFQKMTTSKIWEIQKTSFTFLNIFYFTFRFYYIFKQHVVFRKRCIWSFFCRRYVPPSYCILKNMRQMHRLYNSQLEDQESLLPHILI